MVYYYFDEFIRTAERKDAKKKILNSFVEFRIYAVFMALLKEKNCCTDN
jgi:hypothetical protein